MATLYKQPKSKNWYCRFMRGGKEVRMSLKTANKQTAEKKLREIMDRVDGNLAVEIDGGHTFDDMMLHFFETHCPNLKPDSVRRYKTSAKALMPHLSGMRLKDISATALYDFEHARRKEGVSGSTIVRDVNCLSSAWEVATAYWELEKLGNPALAFLKSRKRQHGRGRLKNAPPRDRYLSLEEEKKVLAATTRAYQRHVITFAIETGLRLAELCSLEWRDVHFEVEQPYLQLWVGETKTDEGRKVPLLPRAVDVLKDIKTHDKTREAKASPWVFHKSTGAPFGKFTRGLKFIEQRAGVRHFQFHDLRRTCGCRLLQVHRLDMKRVSIWLGHSSMAQTERAYAFLKSEHLQQDADRIRADLRAAERLLDTVPQSALIIDEATEEADAMEAAE